MVIVDQVKKKKIAEAKTHGLSPPPSKKKNVQPPSRKRKQENCQNDSEVNEDGMSSFFLFDWIIIIT
jgi:hypothetical protein